MIRVALPRGDLSAPLAKRLDAVGFHVPGYGGGARTYRFRVDALDGVEARVFSDRDIPIQVALGQYDLGVASRSWVDELLVKHRHESIVPIRPLDLGTERLVLAAAPGATLASLVATAPVLRVATEYPNLVERYLNRARVPRYRVLDVWGNAQAWPPDDAECAVVEEAALAGEQLEAIDDVHRGSAWLIGNRDALAARDLGVALGPLLRLPPGAPGGGPLNPPPLVTGARAAPPPQAAAWPGLRMALPDGHAQRHAVAALAAAGLAFDGYGAERAERRPRSRVDGLELKVIRPQDMPRAVALGSFDLALTGRDWLAAHRAAFPASPVVELADLGRSRYELGAVVAEDLPAETIEEAVAQWRRDDASRTIRIASEYATLADQYARERHLGRYRVIPISGASEGFIPEDAEILIEGSETGTTMRANRLRMLDTIMVSTLCVIGGARTPDGKRGALRAQLVERLAAAAVDGAEGA